MPSLDISAERFSEAYGALRDVMRGRRQRNPREEIVGAFRDARSSLRRCLQEAPENSPVFEDDWLHMRIEDLEGITGRLESRGFLHRPSHQTPFYPHEAIFGPFAMALKVLARACRALATDDEVTTPSREDELNPLDPSHVCEEGQLAYVMDKFLSILDYLIVLESCLSDPPNPMR
ncbi:hypothetical protein BO70DRAFT_356437 [Aspergillus heteromorphus CBS 117.55]|uniref:Uncharacterized protein n=1 Tax=Aspergillus heteromorphus CBS 117.55 TaxID=1448321 RepID=A0A317V038_9EURO|nr:uncharacterized protein BO70DRAFT_356437 [Aspergillus heteromorphus CBS 117.55]PWY66731.1 hypothetical protein BO70DRAFT_356437 [Aspergillus heteromorphus CBS 117.55]